MFHQPRCMCLTDGDLMSLRPTFHHACAKLISIELTAHGGATYEGNSGGSNETIEKSTPMAIHTTGSRHEENILDFLCFAF